jgi:hypothetical protein
MTNSLLIDTDALIAVGNTDCWKTVFHEVGLTTTYVVKGELERHVKEGKNSSEGSPEWYRYNGSKRAIDGIENGSISLVNTVPKPHGKDAGEESLRRQMAQEGDRYDAVFLMDRDGRESIKRTSESNGYDVKIPSPAFPLYIAYDNGLLSKKEFCEACRDITENEGWTGYRAVKVMWDGIPVDCSAYVESDYLP